MPFNSYQFILGLLPVALAAYWIAVRYAGQSTASTCLLIASIAFYAHSGVENLLVIGPFLVVDFFIAKTLLRISVRKSQLCGRLFAAGVVINIAFLGYFKYTNFFVGAANAVLEKPIPLTELALPLGISFLTFQKIAFLADVQSGAVKSFRFRDFLLFMFFFPRTTAGPIVHYQEVMPQLAHPEPRNAMTNISVGVCLLSIGLFKKAVIADEIAQFVSPAFDFSSPSSRPALLTAWIGVLAYTFQLYFDFSGYSDMALGTARMFGVRLPMNFNSPLQARSIVEFWGRWHITLTRFLTDYIYTPIMLSLTRRRLATGNPVLRGKNSSASAMIVLIALPTLTTMIISGLWHGAGWQFLVWGLLHGIYLTINQCWRILRPRFWKDGLRYERFMQPAGYALTFGAVVVAQVFFRANSVGSALSILGAMIGLNGILPPDIQLLHSLNFVLPWAIVVQQQPVAPFVWIVALFLGTLLLPNSLALLRRYGPALDYPAKGGSRAEDSFRTGGLAATWAALKNLARNGLILNPLVAQIGALLCILGIMGFSKGSTFLYGQF